jgi:hypothetical protein
LLEGRRHLSRRVKSHHPCPRLASVGVSHILAFRGLPLG